MATIVTRAGKGSPLTNVEVDANFTNLNNDVALRLLASSNLSDLANAATARTNLGLGNVENKSSATIRGELSSGNVTTALGFTPYNATNPSSYVNASGARSALSFVAGSGAYNSTTGVITIPTNTSQLTNGAGFTTNTGTVTSVSGTGTVSGLTLSGSVTSSGSLTLGGTLSLTSLQVTTALGFTPYNSTNPSGYITSSGSITGNAATATSVTGVAGVLGYTTSAQNTAAATGVGPQVTGQGGGGAVLSFHRPGAYGLNMGLDSDNVFRIGGWSASANRLQMDMTGNLTMNGNVTAYSDERLKTDWADLPSDFVDRLATVKHGTYTRIDSGERQAGASAQDMQRLLAEFVSEGKDDAKTLALAYGNAALVSAIKLAQRVIDLEIRVKGLLAAMNTQR